MRKVSKHDRFKSSILNEYVSKPPRSRRETRVYIRITALGRLSGGKEFCGFLPKNMFYVLNISDDPLLRRMTASLVDN